MNNKKVFECPECGHDLKCMCVISANDSGHGREEQLLHCKNCLRDWIDIDGEELQRKFGGNNYD